MKLGKGMILSIGSLAILITLLALISRPAETPIEAGVIRADVQVALRSVNPSAISGLFVTGGNKMSNLGNYESRNIAKAHELYNKLLRAKTTDSELIKMGKDMHLFRGASSVGILYLEKGSEHEVRIPIRIDKVKTDFGDSCGSLIRELWQEVSE